VSKRDKDEVKAILNFKNEKAPYKLQSLNFNQVPLSQKKKKKKKKKKKPHKSHWQQLTASSYKRKVPYIDYPHINLMDLPIRFTK
jgi:hypothetical protein